jgi:hypothetical protein
VTALPGLTPILPEITAGPVAVIAVPASAAKLSALPSGGTLWAKADEANNNKLTSNVEKIVLDIRITERIDISP